MSTPTIPTPPADNLFYRNLVKHMKKTRPAPFALKDPAINSSGLIDFSSNDLLSFGSSGVLKKEFLSELARNPDFLITSPGSRMTDGNNEYIEALERDFASWHNGDCALALSSGWAANEVIFTTLPQPGDAVVFDELMHASARAAIESCRANIQQTFKHNTPSALRNKIEEIASSSPAILSGEKMVLIAVESLYSMDGSLVPLQDMLDAASEALPAKNFQFIIDEAHTSGVVSTGGRGYTCALGLERHPHIAARMFTYGKALACTGGMVVTNEFLRTYMINYGRNFIFTTAMTFVQIATMRAGLNLLMNGEGQRRQLELLHAIDYFVNLITSHRLYEVATSTGVFSLEYPETAADGINPHGSETEITFPINKPLPYARSSIFPYRSQVVPLYSNVSGTENVAAHLRHRGYKCWFMYSPAVPRGRERVRVSIHAGHTREEMEGFVKAAYEWVERQLSAQGSEKLRKAARVERRNAVLKEIRAQL